MSLRTFVKKSTKRFFPPLFKLLKSVNWTVQTIRMRNLGSIFGYYRAMMKGEVYEGSYLYANLKDQNKGQVMDKFIKRELANNKGKDFQILEIGSWVGSSAMFWANACKNAGIGRVFCVDPHDTFDSIATKHWWIFAKGKMAKLFIHNIWVSGLNRFIVPMLGKSNVVLPNLKNDNFNVIYIDGDHCYSVCLEDIKNSMPLIKEGGIICGDDLELQLHEVDYNEAWANRNDSMDNIKDTKSGRAYHHGVALAVAETLGRVSVNTTFWAMRKVGNGWQPIDL